MHAILKSGLGPPPRILRLPADRARTGLARRTIDLCIAPGRFPRPGALGGRAVDWIEVEVDAGLRPWIEASRREPEPRPRSGGQTRLVRPFGWFGNLSTEAEFHEARNRRLAVEVTWEPGETIGVMLEDGGAARESAAGRSEGYEPEWRHAMAEKFFSQGGDDYPKTVSGERIDEFQRGAAHDEERDGAEAERLARRAPAPAAGKSERDRAWCLEALRRGLDPAIVRARLEERRANDQPNPEDYARRTLERAAAALRQEIPGPEIER